MSDIGMNIAGPFDIAGDRAAIKESPTGVEERNKQLDHKRADTLDVMRAPSAVRKMLYAVTARIFDEVLNVAGRASNGALEIIGHPSLQRLVPKAGLLTVAYNAVVSEDALGNVRSMVALVHRCNVIVLVLLSAACLRAMHGYHAALEACRTQRCWAGVASNIAVMWRTAISAVAAAAVLRVSLPEPEDQWPPALVPPISHIFPALALGVFLSALVVLTYPLMVENHRSQLRESRD